MTKTVVVDVQKPNVHKYNQNFYGDGGVLAYSAASLILSEISSFYPFASLVDFGCGAGGWLRAARDTISKRNAVPEVFGIEGPYAKSFANCEGGRFLFQDLETRIILQTRFDLAISMEVAEHLTAPRASTFVEDLCNASDVVLFSAAIPSQGGTNHINEHWQSYWIELFRGNGYRCFDVLRVPFWNDESFVKCSFYVSNGFLYVKHDHALTTVLKHREVSESSLVDVVHPQLFLQHQVENLGILALTKQFPKMVRQFPITAMRALRRRM